MIWLWVVLTPILLFLAACLVLHIYIFVYYVRFVGRIFQEKPIFIVPIGQPVETAEEVVLPTTHGLKLHGCYLKTPAAIRKGVILFGLEYGSNCWACLPYCEFLVANGYDVFAFETRGQGNSQAQPGYDPLQWVTAYEVDDFRAAVAYLKQRSDADPRGLGFFGLSKGGSAGLFLAAEDAAIRCCAVDGIFSHYTTMVPYMQKWALIYLNKHRRFVVYLLPVWYFKYIARRCLRTIGAERHCSFPFLEEAIGKIAPKPLLMIHGSDDNYIKPEMAQALYDLAGGPKQFWLVEGAKHNQCMTQAGDEYKARLVQFFDENLAPPAPVPAPAPIPDMEHPSTNGVFAKHPARGVSNAPV